MKRFITLLLCITFVMESSAREFEVRGPQGGLAATFFEQLFGENR